MTSTINTEWGWPSAMSLNNQVNMMNCYKHCEHFFKRFESTHFDVLIVFWMMAGYLGPADSVDKVYQKGLGVLWSLIQEGMLRPSDKDGEVIELVTSTDLKPVQCKHQGVCIHENVGFVDFLDLAGIENIVLTDGMLKKRKAAVNGNYISRQVLDSLKGLKYLTHFNPRPNFLKLLLENVQQLSVLILRGYEELLPLVNFPFDKFKTLSILEISGPSHLTTIPARTISQMTRLQCLNLANLLIESLPHDFFSNLVQLRWLILRGCSKLHYLPQIYHLEKLEVLDLSYTDLFSMPILSKFTDIPPPPPFPPPPPLPSFIPTPPPSPPVIPPPHPPPPNIPCQGPSAPTISRRHSWDCIFPPPDTLSPSHSPPSIPRRHSCDCLFLPPDTFSQPPLSPGSPQDAYDYFFTDPDTIPPPPSSQHHAWDYFFSCPDTISSPPTIPPPPENVPLETYHSPVRNLILRKCTSLRELPGMVMLTTLEVLDISGCKELCGLPKDLCNLKNLRLLNLSDCSGLRKLSYGLFDQMSSLLKLDLSGTEIKHLPSLANLTSLRTLSLRDLELDSLENLSFLSNLIELNLSGIKISSSQMSKLDFLESLENLQILNLSISSVVKLPAISNLTSLRILLLANCQYLEVVPDLSLPDNSTLKNCQPETDTVAEGPNSTPLLVPSSLRKLVLTNRSGMRTLYPLPPSPGNSEFHDVFGSKETEFITVPLDKDRMENVHGQISKTAEIHIVSSIRNQLSRFDQFTHEFRNLYTHILGIQKNFSSAMTTATTSNHHFQKQLEMLHNDLMYIQENIEMIQSSRNYKSGEELLQQLMEVTAQLSSTESSTDLANLTQLIRTVVKLKLIIPPKEAHVQDDSKFSRKKKQSSITRIMNMENASVDVDESSFNQDRVDLLCSYQSLTDIQKYCLLCFSTFPCNEDDDQNTGVMKSLVIKKKILIFLWAGEGVIDQVSHDMCSTQHAGRANTIEVTGKQILKVLRDKGFIEPVLKKHQETGSCRMRHFVHYFVTAMAKEVGFFYFNKQNRRLTPYFTRSRRDCLLQFQDRFPFCKLQVNYENSDKDMESLSDVLTLFNNNESEVDIKPEWFSKMKHLSVLYLGSWRSENAKHIEVVDEKFLGSLKNMKQLRFLSLQGFLTITKLPDSICKLINLKILDLRECSYLEELPANIGFLKNLTHLDITNCRFLNKLPKGICLLSKLEVLKGFVITHHDCDPQDRKVCILEHWWDRTKKSVIHGLFRCKNDEAFTFRDLLKIKKLRDLSLVIVNIYKFFDDEYLDVFKEMRGLRKLKIIWERSVNRGRPNKEWDYSSESEYSFRPLRWQKLKCWERQPSQSDTEETSSRSNQFQNVEKLELWCLPHDTIPFWLDPKNMKNLKKLYIIGGNLETMPVFEDEWNVTTLRFKYMEKFDSSWSDLKRSFPYLTYLECYQCKLPMGLPYSEDGVWRAESEGNKLAEE